MNNSHYVLKTFANRESVRERGEDIIHLDEIHISKGLERLEIVNIIGGPLGKERSKIYYIGRECSEEERIGKTVIYTGKLVYKRDKIAKYAITESGTIYAMAIKDNLIDPNLVVDGKYVGGIKASGRTV